MPGPDEGCWSVWLPFWSCSAGGSYGSSMPLMKIIGEYWGGPHGICLHCYTDNTQLYLPGDDMAHSQQV